MRLASTIAALTLLTASQAHASLTTATQDGFKITWTLLSQPNNARMIAVCPFPFGEAPAGGGQPILYALNAPTAPSTAWPIYRSYDEGKTWTNLNVAMPAGVTSIACSLPFNDNSPQRLSGFIPNSNPSRNEVITYYGANMQSRSVYFTGLSSTKSIQSSGTSGFVALNVGVGAAGGGIWAGDVYYNAGTASPWSPWTASAAALVTFGRGRPTPFVGGGRLFARNVGTNFLYYVNTPTGSSTTWTKIASVGTADYLDQISAASSTVLFALQSNPNTPTVRKLYKAVFTETNCTDGIDNDQDSWADDYDADCAPVIK